MPVVGTAVSKRDVPRRLRTHAYALWAVTLILYWVSFATSYGVNRLLGSAILLPASVCMAVAFSRFKAARALEREARETRRDP